MNRGRRVTRQCEHCGEDFQAYVWAIKKGDGRFCSNSCSARQHWAEYPGATNRYRGRYLPKHPLADAHGIVREHRFVLYDKIGPGTHPCHWCGVLVTWKNFKDTDRTDMLVSDHVDTDKRNNDPDNLVPSCNACNLNRVPRPRVQMVGDDELFVVDARGWRHRAGRRTCEVCGAEFLRHLWQLEKPGWGRFCSNACSAIGKRNARQATPADRSDS